MTRARPLETSGAGGRLLVLVALLLAPGSLLAAAFSATQLVQIGESYLKRGDPSSALEPLRQATALDPTLAKAQRLLGAALSSVSGPDGSKTLHSKEAIAALEAAARLEPKHYRGLLLLGMAYDLDGDLAGAVRSYQRAVKVDPERADGWHELGMSQLMLNQQAASLKSLRRAHALAGSSDPQLLADFAYALKSSGKAKQAVALLGPSLAHHPKNAELRFVYGDALATTGAHSKAAAAYQEALQLDPTHWLAAYHRGLALSQLGHLDAALEAQRLASKLRPEDPRPALAEAILLAKTKQLEAATTLCVQLGKHFPREPRVWRLLAKLQQAGGHPQEAARARARAATFKHPTESAKNLPAPPKREKTKRKSRRGSAGSPP